MIDEINKELIESPSVSTEESSTTALTTIDTGSLQQEAIAIINQLVAETDVNKAKDLTYLFNLNQNKKTLVRVNKLSDLMDKITDQAFERFSKKPDEISNKEMLDAMKTVADLIERGQTQVTGQEEAPLIQINQQNNEVNMEGKNGLNRESREKVKTAVMELLKQMASGNTSAVDNIIDATTSNKEND